MKNKSKWFAFPILLDHVFNLSLFYKIIVLWSGKIFCSVVDIFYFVIGHIVFNALADASVSKAR